MIRMMPHSFVSWVVVIFLTVFYVLLAVILFPVWFGRFYVWKSIKDVVKKNG